MANPKLERFERATAPRNHEPVTLPLEDDEWHLIPLTSEEQYDELVPGDVWNPLCSHVIIDEVNGVELVFGELLDVDIKSIRAAMRGTSKPELFGEGPYLGTIMPAEGEWVPINTRLGHRRIRKRHLQVLLDMLESTLTELWLQGLLSPDDSVSDGEGTAAAGDSHSSRPPR